MSDRDHSGYPEPELKPGDVVVGPIDPSTESDWFVIYVVEDGTVDRFSRIDVLAHDSESGERYQTLLFVGGLERDDRWFVFRQTEREDP